MSELPTYARRFRCAFDDRSVDTGANTQHLKDHLCPDGCDGGRLFTPYIAPDGGTVTYENANDITLLALEDGANDYKTILTGNSSAPMFGMIYEYLKSRRNMREESDPSTEFPDTDGLMNTLFATSEDTADDVTGAVDDYNLDRPYSETDAVHPVLGAQVQAGTTNYKETFTAPLGLLKLSGFGISDGDAFIVDVEAVYEM